MKNDLPVFKNQILDLVIESITEAGDGIARLENFAIFVPKTVPKDHIRAQIILVKKNYAIARLISVATPSPDRQAAPCPHADRCGGCQFQLVSYESQISYKRQFVKDALSRIGGLENVVVEPVLGMDNPYRYRNKGQYPVQEKDGAANIGFYRPRSHDVVDVDVCLLQTEAFDEIINYIRTRIAIWGLAPYDERTGKGELRHIVLRTAFQTGDVMVVFVINSQTFPLKNCAVAELIEKFSQIKSVVFNVNRGRGNRILGGENHTVWGKDWFLDSIGHLYYEISPQSFFQVNPIQTKVLYDKVVEFSALKKEDTVFDIYCGLGSISLYLADKVRHVVGVEIVEEAIEDAKRNAKRNGVENATFYAGPAEKVIPSLYKKGHRANVVVVDPPRKGCEQAVLETILAMRPEKVVYVSCKPSTLARDLKVLVAGGYEVEIVQPVDMFPMSGHVETVTVLYRQS